MQGASRHGIAGRTSDPRRVPRGFDADRSPSYHRPQARRDRRRPPRRWLRVADRTRHGQAHPRWDPAREGHRSAPKGGAARRRSATHGRATRRLAARSPRSRDAIAWVCGGAAAQRARGATRKGRAVRRRRARAHATAPKTNQEGRLETIAVAYGSEPTTCPVRALRAWLVAAELVAGPLFIGMTPQGGLRTAPLGDRMVAHVVKRRCKTAGIHPDTVAGHSLRRGFATAAARAKKPDRMIKRHGRWKSGCVPRTGVKAIDA